MNSPTVMHVISGLNRGGAEMMLLRLLQNVDASNSIVVSLAGKGELSSAIEKTGATLIELPRTHLLSAVNALRNVIQSQQPQLIQSWLYRADLVTSLAAIGKKIPVVWNIRQSATRRISGQTHIWLVQRINALLSRFLPSDIVYCAHAAKRSHQSIGYTRSKAQVLPNGIDINRFKSKGRREETRESLGINDSDIVLGLVARFDPLKNHHRLLKVVSKVQELLPEQSFKLLLVGNGMQLCNDDLREMIHAANLDDACVLVGEQSTIPSYLQAMDVHVMTSDDEGWPNVLAEALAMGVLSVTTDVGDASKILAHDASSVIRIAESEEQTIEVIARAVIRLTELTPAQRKAWSETAQQHIEKAFDIQQIAGQYSALYRKILSTK